MIIDSIHVKNFRSILDEVLPCDELTALVGRNGSGKSSFLSALQLFYDSSASISREDFYAEDISKEIEIAVTFKKLNKEATELFASYIENARLVVVRVFSDPEAGRTGTYHGMRLQNPEFDGIRRAQGAMKKRQLYNALISAAKYSSLSQANSVAIVEVGMSEWEAQNQDKCVRTRDDGQFFGYRQVGQGYLDRFTKFIHVPAVRNAMDDAADRRGTSVNEIMNLVVRSTLATRIEVKEFAKRTQDDYRNIMDPDKIVELKGLATDLTRTLQFYVPNTEVLLQWAELTDIAIPMPQAEIGLMEDEYASRVERTGHGLQRAFIITMLQHLDAARLVGPADTRQFDEDMIEVQGTVQQLPNLVLAIEEPELYQHPSRQRHLASVMLNLATGTIPGVAQDTQVIYSTHSPLFVGLDRFNQIRVLRKSSESEYSARIIKLRKADMDSVADEIWYAAGKPMVKFTGQTLRPRLQSIMTPWMNEGFFADVVVLVEGEADRAAILGFASARGIELDSKGISVIPCSGKDSLDRPLVVFRQLGIATYVVWDGDYDENPSANRKLLRLLDRPEEDWPAFVEESSACFKVNLEKTLQDEIGSELYDVWLLEAQEDLGIASKEHAMKSPAIIEQLARKASSDIRISTTVDRILDKIVALAGNP